MAAPAAQLLGCPAGGLLVSLSGEEVMEERSEEAHGQLPLPASRSAWPCGSRHLAGTHWPPRWQPWSRPQVDHGMEPPWPAVHLEWLTLEPRRGHMKPWPV